MKKVLLFIIEIDDSNVKIATDEYLSVLPISLNDRKFNEEEHYSYGEVSLEFSEFMMGGLPENIYILYDKDVRHDISGIEHANNDETEIHFIDTFLYFGMSTKGVLKHFKKEEIYASIFGKLPFNIIEDNVYYKYREVSIENNELDDDYEIKNSNSSEYNEDEETFLYENENLINSEVYDFKLTDKLENFLRFNIYYGVAPQGYLYKIDLNKMAPRLEDKVMINFSNITSINFNKRKNHKNSILIGENSNKKHSEFIKFSFLLDVYEGFCSVENMVLKDEYLTMLRIMKTEDDETRETILPFSIIRYLILNNVIKELKIKDIYVGSKMYINPRDAFDISMSLRFDPLLRSYINSYILMYMIEISRLNNNSITHIHLSNYTIASSIEIDHPLLIPISNY